MQHKMLSAINILMCKPTYFGIFYKINPWMDINNHVDIKLAALQWEALSHTILNCGAKIQLIPPVEGLPDLVFTSNGGAEYLGNMVLSRFKHQERQAEVPYFKNWFKQHGYTI